VDFQAGYLCRSYWLAATASKIQHDLRDWHCFVRLSPLRFSLPAFFQPLFVELSGNHPCYTLELFHEFIVQLEITTLMKAPPSHTSFSSHPLLNKPSKTFLIISAILLLLTAILKFLTVLQPLPLLEVNDPVFHFLKMRTMLFCSAILEISIAFVVLFNRTSWKSFFPLLWLASVFLTYRHALKVLRYSGPCNCLGDSWKWINIDHATAYFVSGYILLFFLIASLIFLSLFLVERHHNRLAPIFSFSPKHHNIL